MSPSFPCCVQHATQQCWFWSIFRGVPHFIRFTKTPFIPNPTGTEILTVQAADNDDPKTDNVRIFYRLVVQIPETPRALFRVDRDSGVISVQADSMEGTAPQYTLTITAEDAKGDLFVSWFSLIISWFVSWFSLAVHRVGPFHSLNKRKDEMS